MPFATLPAVVSYLQKLCDFAKETTIVIQSDIAITKNVIFNVPNFYNVNVHSLKTGTERSKIIGAVNNNLASALCTQLGKLTVYNAILENVCLKANSNSGQLVITGEVDFNIQASGTHVIQTVGNANSVILYNTANVKFSGNCFSTIYAGNCGYAQIDSNVTLSGDIVGKRYHVVNSGVVNTNGRGANCIPGTAAGTCDANSKYF